MFEHGEIDDRVVKTDGNEQPAPAALATLLSEEPRLAAVRRAALLYSSPSPAELKMAARWLVALDRLAEAGLSAEERLQLLMRAVAEAYEPDVYPPPRPVLREAMDGVDDDTLVEAAEAFIALDEPVASGEAVVDDEGLTPHARQSLDYVAEQIAERRLVEGIGPLAESRRNLCVTVRAAELRDLEAWCEADDARKNDVARAVEESAAAYGLQFVGLETYADFSVAVFAHEQLDARFSLVPGGSYERGLSEREEELVRAAGEADPDAGNWYETYQFLIDQAPTMRPVTEVTVGPFLIAQHASAPRDPAEIAAMLEELPFRLPTEAEHEWAQRGGRPSQLTWRGDDVPTEEWLEDVFAAGDDLRNPFGLVGLGLSPEMLCDVWAPNYGGAPTDGSARIGEGPRVVRGGAEMVYPWQACGEWQLLTNAVRASSDAWEFFLALRPALGVLVSE